MAEELQNNKGSDIAPGGQVKMLDPKGDAYEVPEGSLKQARDMGWTTASDEEIEQAKFAKEHPIQNAANAAGSFAEGAVKAVPGLDTGLNYLASGLSGKAEQDIEEEENQRERLHPTAHTAGKVVGAIDTGILASPALKALGAGAEGAYQAGRVGKITLEGAKDLTDAGLTSTADQFTSPTMKALIESGQTEGNSLGSTLAGKVINYGTQGAAASSPEAAKQAFEGDPLRAAETLAMGAGLGSTVGLIGTMGEKMLRSAAMPTAKFIESGAAAASHPIVSNAVGKVVQKAAIWGPTAVGGYLGGGVGALVGREVGKEFAEQAGEKATLFAANFLRSMPDSVATSVAALREAAFDPIGSGFGGMVAAHAESYAAQALARIPELSQQSPPGAAKKASVDDIAPTQSQEDFKDYSEKLTALATDPDKLVTRTAHIASVISHDPSTRKVATAMQDKVTGDVAYLYNQLPKPPPREPFQDTDWKPTTTQMASFNRVKEAVANPFSILESLRQGVLQSDQVQAVAERAPKLYEQMQRVVAEMAMSSAQEGSPLALTRSQRQQLGLLAGINLDPLGTPQVSSTIQKMYADAGNNSSSSQPKSPRLKSSVGLGTESQRVAEGGSK